MSRNAQNMSIVAFAKATTIGVTSTAVTAVSGAFAWGAAVTFMEAPKDFATGKYGHGAAGILLGIGTAAFAVALPILAGRELRNSQPAGASFQV